MHEVAKAVIQFLRSEWLERAQTYGVPTCSILLMQKLRWIGNGP